MSRASSAFLSSLDARLTFDEREFFSRRMIAMTLTLTVAEAVERADLNSLAENIATAKKQEGIPKAEEAVRDALQTAGVTGYSDAQIAEVVEHFEWMIGQHLSLSVQ